MMDSQTIERISDFLKLLNKLEKYINSIPEPFGDNMPQYKRSMEIMGCIANRISQELPLNTNIIHMDETLYNLQLECTNLCNNSKSVVSHYSKGLMDYPSRQ